MLADCLINFTYGTRMSLQLRKYVNFGLQAAFVSAVTGHTISSFGDAQIAYTSAAVSGLSSLVFSLVHDKT